MSAVFKNAKKKSSQIELRRLMNEHKTKLKPIEKIDSPLAKYTETGQLTCVLCKSVVRSESVWKVHINAKQHKENVEKAKQFKQETNNFSTPPIKRPASPLEASTKKVKGILKNASSNTSAVPDNSTTVAAVPKDFFDTNLKKLPKNTKNSGTKKESSMQNDVQNGNDSELLPEGFFDDPKLDAKARNLEYKNPADEEWEKFQKEIKEVDNKSAEIIAEDQEEATTERQIDEIEEQMRNWSRVLDLEHKKENVKIIAPEEMKMEISEASSDGEDDDIDEFLDWRSKKSFK